MKTTNTLDSLVFLTNEPDEYLYLNIANAILEYGNEALPLLNKKLKCSTDLYQKERLKSLIYNIERQDVISKLNSWSDNREYDLLEPFFILSRNRFPEADWSWFGFQIVMIIEQAEKELNPNLTPLEQVKTLNHIIYEVNKFRGDTIAINNPDYYYANTLLETRIGNPLSLGMLYCIVAERLNIPIYGIDLPNHFILAFCKKTDNPPKLEDVLFYINPFNKGVVLTRKDIRNYLAELKIQSELKYFEPTRNSNIVKKMLRTVKNVEINMTKLGMRN